MVKIIANEEYDIVSMNILSSVHLKSWILDLA